jgi:hypothetical protein
MNKIYKASRKSASAIASPDKMSLVVTLNDEGMMYQQGLISTRSEMVPYNKINSVNVQQGPLQNTLDYGTVIVVTGNDVEPIRLVDIENPYGLRQDLEDMMEAAAHPEVVLAPGSAAPGGQPTATAPTPPASSAQSPEDELVKLAALRDQGIITPDDFNRKKQQLLGL